ncbi:MAG: DUF116 domain-containing protein [Candidatus Brockarchaeota archaeon]|nr:DUF116 domain-containing protein [Candidatus Brockarchaeota archaeon]
MPYPFSFDLTRVSRSFFAELAKLSEEHDIHRRLGENARRLAKKFRVSELTGLEIGDALKVIEDMADIYVRNLSQRNEFREARKRALILPHCSRKNMDSKCWASFDAEVSSYRCKHCSSDCLISQATDLGEGRDYDVYVVPGGSCIHKIVEKYRYDAILGVACSEELKLAANYLKSVNITGQGLPLTKNGCAHTVFSIESLKGML